MDFSFGIGNEDLGLTATAGFSVKMRVSSYRHVQRGDLGRSTTEFQGGESEFVRPAGQRHWRYG